MISNFLELKPEELRVKLGKFLARLKGEKPIVALGLSRRDVIVRLLNLPRMARKPLREALTLQVEMFKPTDSEQYSWDTSNIVEDKQLAVSLVLAPLPALEHLASLFAQAGYPISVLTVSQFSILHLYLNTRPQLSTERLILLDALGSNMELAFLDGEKLVYSNAIDLPDSNVSPEQAVIAEIQRAVSTLRWHVGAPVCVSLCGAVSESLEEALRRFGTVDHFETRLRSGGLDMAVALGEWIGAVSVALAGIRRRRGSYRINLLPAERRPVRQHWQQLPLYALLAANALLLAALGLRTPIQNYELLHQYRKETASLKPQVEEMNAVLEKDKQLRQTLILLEDFKKHGRQPLDALSDLTQRLPQDAWLNMFTWRKGQIDLMGTAKSASTLLPLIQASPQFSEVKFNGALTKDAAGMDHFRLEMRMREKQ
jgi:general secretion pathway protein L